jgi:hypothetical protein
MFALFLQMLQTPDMNGSSTDIWTDVAPRTASSEDSGIDIDTELEATPYDDKAVDQLLFAVQRGLVELLQKNNHQISREDCRAVVQDLGLAAEQELRARNYLDDEGNGNVPSGKYMAKLRSWATAEHAQRLLMAMDIRSAHTSTRHLIHQFLLQTNVA